MSSKGSPFQDFPLLSNGWPQRINLTQILTPIHQSTHGTKRPDRVTDYIQKRIPISRTSGQPGYRPGPRRIVPKNL